MKAGPLEAVCLGAAALPHTLECLWARGTHTEGTAERGAAFVLACARIMVDESRNWPRQQGPPAQELLASAAGALRSWSVPVSVPSYI